MRDPLKEHFEFWFGNLQTIVLSIFSCFFLNLRTYLPSIWLLLHKIFQAYIKSDAIKNIFFQTIWRFILNSDKNKYQAWASL